MTVESILSAIETRQADISVRIYRQYGITPLGADYPALFITLNEEGVPMGNDDTNYFVDEAGNERSLTDTEETAIVAALEAREHDHP